MAKETNRSVECVDLSCPHRDQLVSNVREACIEVGFFYVVNHGVEKDLLREVLEQSKRFFSLPLEDKMKLLQDENNRGYTPFKEETLDPTSQVVGDLKEGYYIGIDVPKSHPLAKKPLHGPNQWPPSDLLPHWRETMEAYFKKVLSLARSLTRLIALALNLDENFFDKPGILDIPMAALRLLHYSADRSQPENGIFGAGAHSDYGMLTLLLTDDVPGLQICRKKDEFPQRWEDVPPIEGAFIVNLGDMLERWSNDHFRSTLHRVINPGFERYSVAFFFEPNYDCLVECLPTCSSETDPPKYAAIKSGEHLMGRYRITHVGFDESLKPRLLECVSK